MHQVILNILLTKDLDNKYFDYIYPWGKTLAYIASAIRASYHRTIMATLGLAVFGKDMISDLVSVVDWQFITAANQQQEYIDNVQ